MRSRVKSLFRDFTLFKKLGLTDGFCREVNHQFFDLLAFNKLVDLLVIFIACTTRDHVSHNQVGFNIEQIIRLTLA